MLAFVFPGQGAQSVGMGRDLARQFSAARAVFDEADAALGERLSRLCFEGPAPELQLTANAQPAILTTSIALLRVIESEIGFAPQIVAGHSLGEYSALVCAGALAFADAVRITNKRGLFMQQAMPAGQGGMVAVMGMSAEAVEALCREVAAGRTIVAANYNGAGQVVVAGHSDALQRFAEQAKVREGTVIPLKVSAPFHSPLMAPAAEALAPILASTRFSDAKVPVVSNVEASPYQSATVIADLLRRQVTAPVRWEASVQRMAAMGVTHAIEVGPGKALTGLMKRIEKAIVASTCEGPADIASLSSRADLVRFASQPRRELSWTQSADGSRLAGDRLVWASGEEERVDEVRWRITSGAKMRRYGPLAVIWPDGKLEILSDEEWQRRQDGAFVRKDRRRVINLLGSVEDFDPASWEIQPDGTAKRKDGSRIIWPDGLEWRPDPA